MPCVRPFAVRVNEPRTTAGLVLACDAYTAAHRHMHSITRVLHKAERNRLMDRGRARAVQLYPYRIGDRAAFFAENLEHARAIARPILGETALPARADYYDVLVTLPDAELVRQATYVWTSVSKGSDLDRMAPIAFQHNRWRKKRRKKMQRMTRLQIAMALRLAIELPWVASPTPRFYSIDGDPKRKETDTRRRRHDMHDGNVGAELVDAMMSVVGSDMQPYDETARHVIARFCQAYGQDPAELRWTEIAALWCGGEVEMAHRRLDDSLGLYEYFRHGRP